MVSEDPFVVLALEEDAPPSKVESAYRHLALRCHPDRHPKDPLAKSRFLRISRAKETLLDPSKRRAALSQRHARLSKQKNAQGIKRKDEEYAKRQDAERQRAATRLKKQREMAAEKLKRKEAEAELNRKCQAQEMAKRKRDRAIAEEAKRKRLVAEEVARERAAEHLRMKAAVFDAFLDKKRAKVFQSGPASMEADMATLIERFATSEDATLIISGPLGEKRTGELIAAVQRSHSLVVAQEGASFRISRGYASSDSAFACESSQQVPSRDGMTISPRKFSVRKHIGRGATEKHREALGRLQARRQSGEGLMQTSLGSWWVRDEEADRWSRYIERGY